MYDGNSLLEKAIFHLQEFLHFKVIVWKTIAHNCIAQNATLDRSVGSQF